MSGYYSHYILPAASAGHEIHARTVSASSVSVRQWRGLVGTLTAMGSQVPMGRLHRRPIQLSFHNRWSQRKHSLSQLIPLRPNDQLFLSLWSRQSNVMVGQTLVPFTGDLTIFTDASLEGWGAHTDSTTASGRRPPQWRSFAINWLDLEAIRLALVSFKPLVVNEHVLVMCDNKTAVAYIYKPGGTRSKRLFLLAKSIFL